MKTLVIDLKCHTIFLPEDVDRVKSILNMDYHIYAILLSHKYYLKFDEIKQEKGGIFLPVFSPTEQINFTIPFRVYEGLDHTKIIIDSLYPYENFSVTIEDDDWKSKYTDKDFQLSYNVSKIADKVLFSMCNDREYKISYIGQAYGTDGNRIAVDRLISHSTLQKILSDCQSKYTEYNVRILLLGFQQDYHIEQMSFGNTFALLSTIPILSEKQIINITEAALINYFKPEYNKDFISNFPSNTHSSYREIYDVGYTELALDLSYLFEAEEISSLLLYTDHNRITKEKKFIHYRMENCGSIISCLPFDNEQ